MPAGGDFPYGIGRAFSHMDAGTNSGATLEQALKLFQEGTGLVKTCDEMLSEAELQVVKLMKGADGAPVETEYTRDE